MLDKIESIIAKLPSAQSYAVEDDRSEGVMLGKRVIVAVKTPRALVRASAADEADWWSSYVRPLRDDVLARMSDRASRSDNVFVTVREDGAMEFYITDGVST